MEKEMEATIMGYVGTTIRIRSNQRQASGCFEV